MARTARVRNPEAFAEALEASGLRQVDLARLTGLTRQRINQLMGGVERTAFRHARKIERALRRAEGDLFEYDHGGPRHELAEEIERAGELRTESAALCTRADRAVHRQVDP